MLVCFFFFPFKPGKLSVCLPLHFSQFLFDYLQCIHECHEKDFFCFYNLDREGKGANFFFFFFTPISEVVQRKEHAEADE